MEALPNSSNTIPALYISIDSFFIAMRQCGAVHSRTHRNDQHLILDSFYLLEGWWVAATSKNAHALSSESETTTLRLLK